MRIASVQVDKLDPTPPPPSFSPYGYLSVMFELISAPQKSPGTTAHQEKNLASGRDWG